MRLSSGGLLPFSSNKGPRSRCMFWLHCSCLVYSVWGLSGYRVNKVSNDLFSFSAPHQTPSSALPSAPSSPAAGSRVRSGSRPSLSPAPLSPSGSAWRPLQLAFSHTYRIGWRLGREQRSRVRRAGVMGRRLNISQP